MKYIVSLLTLAVLAFGPVGAVADTLCATYGNGLYQFNTAVGAGSQSTVTNFFGTVTTAVTVDSHGNIFVATGGNFSTDFGDIYEITASGVLHTVATGLNYPVCLAVDSMGDLFEFDNNGTNLNEFVNTGGTLSSTPITFASGFGGYDNALAFDSGGDLFVSSDGSTYEFTNNAGSLSTETNYFYSEGFYCMAFDSNGDLFVGEGGYDGLLEFMNTGGTLSSTPVVVSGDLLAYGLAFDSHGNLFVSDENDGNIYEFSNNGGTLSSTPTTFASSLYASGLAFLPVAPPPNLYVTDGDHNLIYSFNTTIGASSQTLFSGAGVGGTSLGSLAFDNYGDLFISDYYYLYEVTNNAGTLSASNTIEINEEGVSFGCGGGVAFDNSSNLFVGDYMYAGINKLTPTATPGIWNNFPLDDPNPFLAPAGFAYSLAFDNSRSNLFDAGGGYLMEFGNLGASIGQTTRLVFPAPDYGYYGGGVAVDSNGNLFVGVVYGISEFTNTPTGVSTTQTLFASGLSDVTSLAFGAGGNLFAADGTSGNVYEFVNTGGVLSSAPVLFATGLFNAAGLAVYIAPGAPVPPMLNISSSGNTVTVFWQDVSGWSLQQNNNLTVPSGWTGSSGVTTSNGTNYLNITQPTGNLFFRLANP